MNEPLTQIETGLTAAIEDHELHDEAGLVEEARRDGRSATRFDHRRVLHRNRPAARQAATSPGSI